jgi:hypothetical protein
MQAVLKVVHIKQFWKQYVSGLGEDVAEAEKLLSSSLQVFRIMLPSALASGCLLTQSDRAIPSTSFLFANISITQLYECSWSSHQLAASYFALLTCIDLFADTLCSSTAPHAADKAAAEADVGLPGHCCSGFQHCCTGGLTAAVHEDSRGLAIQCSTLQYDR